MPKFNGHTTFNLTVVLFGALVLSVVFCGQLVPQIMDYIGF